MNCLACSGLTNKDVWLRNQIVVICPTAERLTGDRLVPIYVKWNKIKEVQRQNSMFLLQVSLTDSLWRSIIWHHFVALCYTFNGYFMLAYYALKYCVSLKFLQVHECVYIHCSLFSVLKLKLFASFENYLYFTSRTLELPVVSRNQLIQIPKHI